MNTTATTYPCATWMTTGRICGKPATQARAARYGDTQWEPICTFHVKAAARNRYDAQVPPVAIEGEVADYLAAAAALALAAQKAAAERKAAADAERQAAHTARLWAENAGQWVIAYEPEERLDWPTRATVQVPRWYVRPVPGTSASWDTWEIVAELEPGRPGLVRINRTGSLTPAAADAVAQALQVAAEVAAEHTAAQAEKGGRA